MTTLSKSPLFPNPVALEDGYDLNLLRNSGFYVVTNPAGGSLASGSYFVRVTGANVGGVRKQVQEAVAISDGGYYVRSLGTSGWAAWAQVGGGGAATDIAYTDTFDDYGNGTDTTVGEVLDTLPSFVDARIAANGAGAYIDDVHIGYVQPVPGSSSLHQIGNAQYGAGGNIAAATLSSSNLNEASPRVRHNSLSTPGNSAGLYNTTAFLYPGATTYGGFEATLTFALAGTIGTTERCFVGVTDQVSNNVLNSSGASPDSFTDWNVFGVGFDDGDSNLSLYHCAGSGNPTQVDLGANYPVTADQVYRLKITNPRAGGSFTYSLERIGTINTATGTISTNIPAAGTPLGLRCQVANGGSSETVSIDMHEFKYKTKLAGF